MTSWRNTERAAVGSTLSPGLSTSASTYPTEAWAGAHRVEDLARIYTMLGEYDAAIDQVGILLAVPSPTSVPMLRIDPAWDGMRDHPRFQALLAKYEN